MVWPQPHPGGPHPRKIPDASGSRGPDRHPENGSADDEPVAVIPPNRLGGGSADDDLRRRESSAPCRFGGWTAQRMTTTSRVRGPCTPSTRFSSMSLVAEGPLIQVSGLVGSSLPTASGTPATICPARTTHRW